jgi:hypothetical protein
MRSFTLAALSLVSLPLAVFLAAPTPTVAQDGPVLLSPAAIGQIFCLARTGNDMAPVEGLLTESLALAIRTAEEKSAAIEAANPGEKPPLGDGIPWQTFPDYAPVCEMAIANTGGSTATVVLDYRFPDEPTADFTDVLILEPVEDPMIGAARWRIDNVAYAAGAGDLRRTLDAMFATP